MGMEPSTSTHSAVPEKRKRQGDNERPAHRKWKAQIGGSSNGKSRRAKVKKGNLGGTEEVLDHDIKHLLEKYPQESAEEKTLPEKFSSLKLDILELSSTGDGLAIHDGRVYVVPFSLPGDCISAKVVFHDQAHSRTDFVSVLKPSPDRDDSLIGCKYFATCAGCQFQMLPYPKQLEQKQRVIEKAYANFADITDGLLPAIGETIGSPLQYGYRTKLTPHFNGNHGKGFAAGHKPDIGFQIKGRRAILDIEDCPIGTDALRAGLTERRQFVYENVTKYKNGANLLLRESTNRLPGGKNPSKYTEERIAVSDHNAPITEYVGDFKFVNLANSFFQNNNSILPTFTDYIREHISFPDPANYLVDAYCGSGLFTVTCGGSVGRAVGVDISQESITYARTNAEANGIKNATFICGDAERIFAGIDFPGSETACIIDPPRKGCDEMFLNQLLDFLPKRIVYVSCNVHTQARDLGFILGDDRGSGYRVDSITGFDFFPQTHHVESVAVLTLADEDGGIGSKLL